MNHDLPNRRSIRLPGYDYAQPGGYFVTIRTHKYTLLFGNVVDGEMVLNAYGRVAATYWTRIPRHFPHVELDAFVVMPNHIHGIIVIVDPKKPPGRGEASLESLWSTRPVSNPERPHLSSVGSGDASPLQHGVWPTGPVPGSLGAIVGNFKSIVAKRINRMRKTTGADVWQRNYYEHIIRSDNALKRIREYIATNPARWEADRYYRSYHPTA